MIESGAVVEVIEVPPKLTASQRRALLLICQSETVRVATEETGHPRVLAHWPVSGEEWFSAPHIYRATFYAFRHRGYLERSNDETATWRHEYTYRPTAEAFRVYRLILAEAGAHA
jgi:hypothetical protein